MTTMKITIEDMGVTKTYEKDFGEECILVEDYIETCLAAYDAQGYCNDLEVNIYGLGGNITQSITWDKDNYIQFNEEMDALDDLMSFLEQGKGWTPEELFKGGERGFWSDGKEVYHYPKENWYMGHRY